MQKGREKIMFIAWESASGRPAKSRSSADRIVGIRLEGGPTSFHPTGVVGRYTVPGWKALLDE